MSRVPTILIILAVIAFNIYRVEQEQARRKPLLLPSTAALAQSAMDSLAKQKWDPAVTRETMNRFVSASAVLDPTAADPLPGRYADGNFKVQFARTGDGYNGVVATNDVIYPATAARTADGYSGSYLSGKQMLFFTAKFNGDVLEFTSGQTTYHLKRLPVTTQPQG